ncbi:MAG: carboxypeptidase-like regulatory domain-containing protein [archaeon]
MNKKSYALMCLALVVLLVAGASGASPAMQVTGHIFETNGVSPASGAFVRVTIEGSTVLQTTTNSSGAYTVDVPSTYSGYTDLLIEVFAQKGKTHETRTLVLPVLALEMNVTLKSHPECSDLYDNDNDGRVDYPADPQCASPSDQRENAVSGQGVAMGIRVNSEDFKPLIWLSPWRTVTHNNANGNLALVERSNNYAFEGEQIRWDVLVMDKNGIEKIRDVYGTISGFGQQPGDGEIQVNCNRDSWEGDITAFNAWIGEERLTQFDSNTMGVYGCIMTIESPLGMYGEYFVTLEVEDLDGQLASVDENEYWFLNPILAVTVVGDITFGGADGVRPGTNSYSETLLLQNSADPGSGVMLNMHISGTDFYDPTSSGAKCPTSNVLALTNLAYFATNGNYNTVPFSPRTSGVGDPGLNEGYYWIPYETGNEDGLFPGDDDIYGRQPIIEKDGTLDFNGKSYWGGNVLSPGSDIAITFRLHLPEPCNGDFTDGQVFFWGEAI